MKIENCKLILATSVDEFGDICTCIEDKGNGNSVAANDVDDEYESLFLAAPAMYEMLVDLRHAVSMAGINHPVDNVEVLNSIDKLLAKARGES